MSKKPYGFLLLGDNSTMNYVYQYLDSIHYPSTTVIPGQKPVEDIPAGSSYAIITDPRYLATALLIARGTPIIVVDTQLNPGIKEREDISDYLVLSDHPNKRREELWGSLRRLRLDTLRGRHLLRTFRLPVPVSYEPEPAAASGK